MKCYEQNVGLVITSFSKHAVVILPESHGKFTKVDLTVDCITILIKYKFAVRIFRNVNLLECLERSNRHSREQIGKVLLPKYLFLFLLSSSLLFLLQQFNHCRIGGSIFYFIASGLYNVVEMKC